MVATTSPHREVRLYTRARCAYCQAAKALLTRERVPFVEVDLTTDLEELARISAQTGSMTVPQVFLDGHFIGGFEQLTALAHEGALRPAHLDAA